MTEDTEVFMSGAASGYPRLSPSEVGL